MKIKAFYLHLISLIWLIFLGLILSFTPLNAAGLGMTLAVLTLIFFPGLWLYRLIKIQNDNLPVKILYIIALGFSFYFLLGFLAIIFQLTLNQLTFAIGFLGAVLFFLNFWEDRRDFWQIDFSWLKQQTVGDWLLFGLVVAGAVMAFLGVNAQSDKLTGDGSFHLAILQKVLASEKLNFSNLWPVKTSGLNLVYSFPVWHIFLGFISKILRLNSVTTYTQVLLPLVILTILVVLGFARTVFKNKYLVIISLLTFLFLSLSTGIFYNLVPLRSPDSLVRLLFFPMVMGLTVNYLFAEKLSKSEVFTHVSLVSLAAILMGLVHFTQLLDYLLILGLFLLLWLLLSREKEILKRLGWLLVTLAILIGPYLLIFQWENLRLFFQGNIGAFTDDHFGNKSYGGTWNIYLYAMFSLPLLAIFFKSERRLIFAASVILGLMMISWQIFQLRPLFLRYFGEIFTIRAITDIPSFLYIGFIFFWLIFLLNYPARKKIYAYLISSLFIVGFLLILFFKAAPVKNFIDLVVISAKNPFFYQYFVPIFIVLIASSIIIFIYKNFIRKEELRIQNPTDKLSFAIIASVLFAILALPYLANFKTVLAQNPNGSLVSSRRQETVGDISRIGGKETIDFLKTLPPHAVLVTSNVTISQILLPNISQYMAEYPYGITQFGFSQQLFDPQLTFEARQQILTSQAIDYVISVKESETALFEGEPSLEKIYQKKYSYSVKSGQSSYQKEGEFTVFRFMY